MAEPLAVAAAPAVERLVAVVVAAAERLAAVAAAAAICAGGGGGGVCGVIGRTGFACGGGSPGRLAGAASTRRTLIAALFARRGTRRLRPWRCGGRRWRRSWWHC